MASDSVDPHARPIQRIGAVRGLAPVAGESRFTVAVTDCQGLRDIREPWKALAGRAAEPNIFNDPDFALPVVEGLGLTDDIRAVLVWRCRTQDPQSAEPVLTGVFPYVAKRRWVVAATVGEAFIHPYSMSSAPLVDAEAPAETLRAFLDWLETDPDAPVAWLFRYLPGDGVVHDGLEAATGRSGTLLKPYDAHERAVLDTADQDAGYLEAALSKKARKEYARLRRKLAARGKVTVTRAVEALDVDYAMVEFLALEASGWKGRRGTAAAMTPATTWMFKHIADGLGAAGQCRVDALRLDGIPIAMAISCGGDGHWWLWKIAYDEARARQSPGVLLVLDITETALSADDPEHYDSCALPGHPMIERIWRQRRAYADILLVPARLGPARQRAVTRLEDLRRQAEHAARKLRRLVGKM